MSEEIFFGIETGVSDPAPGVHCFIRVAVCCDIGAVLCYSLFFSRPASSRYGSIVITVDGSQSAKSPPEKSGVSWSRLVLDLYPAETVVRFPLLSRKFRLEICSIYDFSPPRAKHCLDCDKCVLQFDHHCVWLRTCIGRGIHCKFWWYLCEETALSLWTGILYIAYLKANITRIWWKDAIMILLLFILAISLLFLLLLLLFHSYLILTNQTAYELIRRRRIPYMRNIPERALPFSQGIGKNLYNFCCAPHSLYSLERVPTSMEIEGKLRP
ncbi:hypothetical protein Tsubulata_032958 [Turnera subulata]|uniref:S-acyltransferase n=1 Tax=Turnera subulata TaxID=218843 RepID=A0A9Q0J9H7_9ROSI|nr:hypothetical protein Tsubulata_032958 [Turnera subulata]